MAKATLPTNYLDDIMSSSMEGKRRYNLIHNSDGTVSLEDVTDYTQIGSNFGAAQMNQTNTAVNNSADKSKIIDSLSDATANTQAGMMAGALAVRELHGKMKNKIIIGNKIDADIVVTDITPVFTKGVTNVDLSNISTAYKKNAVGVFAQLKSASSIIITSATVSGNTATIKCSNISGTPYDGENSVTLIVFLA